MQVILQAYVEWDLCGGEYLKGEHLDLNFFNDGLAKEYIGIHIPGFGKRITVKKEELKKVLAALA